MNTIIQRLRYFHLAYLSRPACYRPLFRLIRKNRSTNIVQLGIGSVPRVLRMIGLAHAASPGATVNYAAIDLFDMRAGETAGSLPLKEAYRLLKPSGASLRLLPGDPHTSLSRAANGLTGSDLVLISAGHDPESLAKAWFYVPRMLHERSVVLVEETGAQGTVSLRRCPPAEVRERAEASASRRRAA